MDFLNKWVENYWVENYGRENFAIIAKPDKTEEKVNPVQYYVKFSFVITYILLMTTATITFIEAIRTPHPYVRHILNLETCISVVAGYFYSVFVEQINTFSKNGQPVDWSDISKTRYIDWSITTPMMLLTLCLVLGQSINVKVHYTTILSIIALNYMMLYIGYLGEINTIGLLWAMVGGFIPFIAMFYIIFMTFVKPKYLLSNYILFGIYAVVWSLYGIVYLFSDEYKNITMNILDAIAKCLIGIGL